MTAPYRIIKPAAAIAAVCVYFAAAHWLQVNYAPDPNFAYGPSVPGEKIRLVPPFSRLDDSRFAVSVEQYKLFDEFADSDEGGARSTIELYENNTRLGPAHSKYSEIVSLGQGRFSHSKKKRTAVYWSSSDNTDPTTNGRAYWLVKPPASDTRRRDAPNVGNASR